MALIIVQFCSVHKIFLRVQVLAGATLAAAAAAAVAMAVGAAEAVQVVMVEAEVRVIPLTSSPLICTLVALPQNCASISQLLTPQGVTEEGAAEVEAVTVVVVEVGCLTTSKTSLFELDALEIE